MKNFTQKALATLLFIVAVSSLHAQSGKAVKQTIRCGTMLDIDNRLRTDPAFKARYEAGERQFEASKQLPKTARGGNAQRPSVLPGPVTIPVVVHVVLPNPNIITDAAVQYFINRLNLDFSGLNPDSTNGVAFYPVRGHSNIRFVLARRDPAGNFTSGIVRKVGTTQIAGGNPQPIKNSATATGGSTGWDVTQYYNMYVGDGGASGLLGIAPEIGPGGAAGSNNADGVCVDYRAFSNGCFSDPAFNLGRTAVHEIGHNFGLLHTFQGGCADADFGQLSTAGCLLPATLLAPADDTPPLSAPTSGCPNPGTGNGCSPSVPKMFQSFMDYTDDACYSMFSKGEVARMEWVLENCRAGYLTSLGGQYPDNMPLLDAAATAVVSPGGTDFNNTTCTLTSFPTPSCAGAFSPRISITNNGTTVLTSITVTTILNGGTPIIQTLTVNIPTGGSQTVTLTAQNLVVGANNFTYVLSAPNGGTDEVVGNNTLTNTFSVAAAAPLPYSQDFTSTTFPPTGIAIANLNGDAITWTRAALGNGGANGSAFINLYDYDTPNRRDDIRLLPLATVAGDSVILNFDVSHANYPGSPDTLAVYFSTDCGATFQLAGYRKWGATLATAGSMTGRYTNPQIWRTERVGFGGAQVPTGNMIIAIRCTNMYGNNIYIDNINFAKKADVDLKVRAILSPVGNFCSSTITPSVSIQNIGAGIVSGYTVTYTVDGTTTGPVLNSATTLAPNATETFTFPSVTLATGGAHSIKFQLSYVGDLVPNNDTLSGSFQLRRIYTSPLVEGFEGATFPPTDWSIVNPDGAAGVTWTKVAPGNASASSIYINNYDEDFTGQTDALLTPPISIAAGVDSVIISFDVAHKNYPGSNDVLAVLYSNNCGATFSTTTYNKAGATLATAGESTDPYDAPKPSDWRRERVAIAATLFTVGANPLFSFRNTADYGNNIFIDNINISTVYSRDLKLVNIQKPEIQCSESVAPIVTVQNVGSKPITGFTVNYTIDNGAAQTQVFTQTLAPQESASVTLSASTAAVGTHQIVVYSVSAGLISAAGSGDLFTANDTLSKSFSTVPTVALPVSENFEGVTAATFPPTNWAVDNPDGGKTWAAEETVGKASTKSMYINGFDYATGKSTDIFATPVMISGVYDSLQMSFDYAYMQGYAYPGSTRIDLDTLEVQVTTDCGITKQTVWKNWGANLQTVSDPNQPNVSAYKPRFDKEWRTIKLDLGAYAGAANFQVYFVAKTNKQNNLYVDNINVNGKVLPQALKDQGYLIYPSPFTQSFSINHLQTPVDLQAALVYNSAGQLVWDKRFNGTAERQVQVNLTNLAKGVYVLKMVYSNRTVVERIVKN